MFKLVRYFSLAGLASIVIAAIALSASYRHLAITDLIKFGEQQNVNLTQALSNAVGDSITILINSIDKNTLVNADAIRRLPVQTELHDAVLHELRHLPVLKVKLFDRQGTIIYSSNPADIGQRKDRNYPGRRSAETGAIISELDFRESFGGISGTVKNRYVLSSYLPSRDKASRAITGVLEIYTDVTNFYKDIRDAQFWVAVITAAILLLLYGALYVIVKHGDTIIKKQATEREEHLQVIQETNTLLQQSADKLAQAHDDAIAANKSKSQFLANMSHELRTPLNAIIGYSEMLQEDCEEFGHDDFISDLLKIHKSGVHLLNLINEILDLSKIEAGKMTVMIEKIDVHNIVQDVADTIKPLIDKHENTFSVNIPGNLGIMNGDQIKVRQILMNLLSNASKFTKQGQITLAVDKVVRDGVGWIEFRVQDNGIGMTKEQTSNIFSPFSQATETTSRDYGGTGLGLTISQRFCQIMGGRIEVESEPSKGTAFTVILPVEAVVNQTLL